jgi:hypothetical protein
LIIFASISNSKPFIKKEARRIVAIQREMDNLLIKTIEKRNFPFSLTLLNNLFIENGVLFIQFSKSKYKINKRL